MQKPQVPQSENYFLGILPLDRQRDVVEKSELATVLTVADGTRHRIIAQFNEGINPSDHKMYTDILKKTGATIVLARKTAEGTFKILSTPPNAQESNTARNAA